LLWLLAASTKMLLLRHRHRSLKLLRPLPRLLRLLTLLLLLRKPPRLLLTLPLLLRPQPRLLPTLLLLPRRPHRSNQRFAIKNRPSGRFFFACTFRSLRRPREGGGDGLTLESSSGPARSAWVPACAGTTLRQ
jgi:hypothetical protein